jgi:CO dehydrogenase maturation factor
MKIAFSGKGGVGKTSISAALSLYYAKQGKKVLAVDVDPDANLATALGMPFDLAQKITPISQMKELIKERTGAEPGAPPGFFSLNPKVDDIPEEYSKNINGVKLMVMGSVDTGGMGCICPENSLIRALINNLLLNRDEVVIMDMEAGIEHLGRSTADAVDAMIIVVEPGRRSIDTAFRIKKLAADIGLKNIYLVLNNMENENQLNNLKETGLPLLTTVSASESVKKADEEDKAVYPLDDKFNEEIAVLARKLEDKINE